LYLAPAGGDVDYDAGGSADERGARPSRLAQAHSPRPSAGAKVARMHLPPPRIDVIHLDPVRAEIRFTFDSGTLPAGAELRGQLIGPRCPGMTTIEVAYPLRPSSQPGVLHAVIPEPSLWQAERPFVYDAFSNAGKWKKCVAKSVLPLGLPPHHDACVSRSLGLGGVNRAIRER